MEESIKNFIKTTTYYKENYNCGKCVKENKEGFEKDVLIYKSKEKISLANRIIQLQNTLLMNHSNTEEEITKIQSERNTNERLVIEQKGRVELLEKLPDDFRKKIRKILTSFPKDEPIQNFIK